MNIKYTYYMEFWIISFFVGILIGNLIDIKYILFIYFIYNLQHNDQSLFHKLYDTVKHKSNMLNIAIPNINMMFLQEGWIKNTITSIIYGKKEKIIYTNDNNNNNKINNNIFLSNRRNKYNMKNNIRNNNINNDRDNIMSEPFFSL